jgi:hypothetical protein
MKTSRHHPAIFGPSLWQILGCCLAVFASLTLAASAGPADAQDRPVGQIDTARGIDLPDQAVVLRAAGGTTPARSLVRLYDGDRIQVRGAQTRLTVYVAGNDRPIVITRANSPYLVRGRSGGPMSGRVTRVLASLDLMFNRPRMAIATATEARGLGDGLTASAFLPAGPQRLPGGARALLILWSGPASAVQIVQGQQSREWDASAFTSAVIDAPEEGDFDIVLPGDALGWSVARVPEEAAPRGPGVPPTGPLTPEERLANTIWLLAEGEPEWRLFALSDVTDLARTDYGAARLLAAIRAGEIEPEDLAAPAD